MIISAEEWKKINLYIKELENFCAYNINDYIDSFWNIAEKPHLIQKWRERTAIKLYKLEDSSLLDDHSLDSTNQTGRILQLSSAFNEPIHYYEGGFEIIDKNTKDYIEPIKDIDCQICKALCADLCAPEPIRGESLTEEQRMKAISELRKPLKYKASKDQKVSYSVQS